MTDYIECALRAALAEARSGRLPRRRFMAQMAGWGLSIPVAATLLGQAGPARAQPAASAFHYAPTRRGGGGMLRILSWQAATHLNPHLASGSKDLFASRLFYEPLAVFDRDGRLQPVLAAEVPSADNGGVARDGLSVTLAGVDEDGRQRKAPRAEVLTGEPGQVIEEVS